MISNPLRDSFPAAAWSTKPLLTLLSLAIPFASFAATPPAPIGSRHAVFSELSGPSAVGTTQFVWTDPERDETFTSATDDKRVVTVQIWYPAEKGLAEATAPYLLSPEEFSGETEDAGNLRVANSVVATRSQLNAPVAPGRHPVLIYNPGSANTRFLSSFLTEQLASQGFIVAAVEHYGNSMATNFPDGSPMHYDRPPVTLRDEGPNPAPDKFEKDALASILERDEKLMPAYLADTDFSLQKLKRLDHEAGLFHRHFDFNHLGALGWSFGGAAAIQLLVHDPRFKAAANLDGELSGIGKTRLETEKPFLLFTSSPHSYPPGALGKVMLRLDEMVESWYERLWRHSSGPRYWAVVAGSDHGSFLDWNLMLSFFRWQTALTSGDAASAAAAAKVYEDHGKREKIIVNLTAAFFKKYLVHQDVEMPAFDPSAATLRMENAATHGSDR